MSTSRTRRSNGSQLAVALYELEIERASSTRVLYRRAQTCEDLTGVFDDLATEWADDDLREVLNRSLSSGVRVATWIVRDLEKFAEVAEEFVGMVKEASAKIKECEEAEAEEEQDEERHGVER
jgi:hypothetical protein